MDLTGKLTVATRDNPFDVRDLREMIESQAFNVFLKRIDHMIEAERGNCERGLELDAVRRAQGAVAALRAVKRLPETLIGEMNRKQ
jgi:hypothetical protein